MQQQTVLTSSRVVQKRPTVCIKETEWGYVIRKSAASRRRASVGEMAVLAGCIIFGAAAFMQWLLPPGLTSMDMFPFKMGATVVFFVLAVGLYQIARSGLSTEVHVDTARRLIVLVRRNYQGQNSLVASYPFARIDSVYAKRNKSVGVYDTLFIKPKGKNAPVLIASGPSRELDNLLERIRRDLLEAGPVAARRVRRIVPRSETMREKKAAFAAL